MTLESSAVMTGEQCCNDSGEQSSAVMTLGSSAVMSRGAVLY